VVLNLDLSGAIAAEYFADDSVSAAVVLEEHLLRGKKRMSRDQVPVSAFGTFPTWLV
jgi:hypothetical protein